MDDLKYGVRNKRGDWAPSANLTIAPLFGLPPRPLAEVNYGDGLVPLDKLFGAWRDGSPERSARARNHTRSGIST